MQLARIKGLIRARRPKRLPVLLTAGELSRLMARLGAQKWPTAMLMHGAGLQLLAAARLRFKELDCQRRESKLREGKVDKDRLTTMATAVVRPLQEHLGQVRTVHRRYMAHGFGRVEVPHALA
ncbi:MAG TPA: integron integrase, partial [Planctomycetes bacterium]|nr:integron integrase [Planctomycetota bacterium]